MSSANIRLFVAVEVPAAVRDRIDTAAEPLRQRQPDARWVPAGNYHMTLAFIGSAGESEIRSVHEACAVAADQAAPFELTLTGAADTFGSGVLWAGLADSPPLADLASSVRGGLVERELTLETRPFHAHVTLARTSRGVRLRRGLAQAYDGPRSSWPVERIVLMRSRVRRAGTRYTVEAGWRLGDAS